MRVNNNLVLVSVYKAGDVNNATHHAKAKELLRKEGISFEELTGVSQNGTQADITFLLTASDVNVHASHVEAALSLITLFNRERFLEVHNDGKVDVHYVTGNTHYSVGSFVELPKGDKLPDAYVVREGDGRLFGVVE